MSLLNLALATMLAASSPAGSDPVPADVDAADQADSALQQAYARQFPAMQRGLIESSAPRDRALGVLLFKPVIATSGRSEAELGRVLRQAATDAPADRFVQWAWANASPEASGCDERSACSDRAAALALIEPDNGAAWMPVAYAAMRAKDVAATDAALSRVAGASRFDDLFGESVSAWMDVYRRYPLPAQPGQTIGASQAVSAIAVAAAMAISSYQTALACSIERNPGASAARLDDCARIGRLMAREGSTVMARRMGQAVLRMSGKASAEDADAARKLDWISERAIELWQGLDADPKAFEVYVADLRQTGSEIRAVELLFTRAGIALEPPVGWEPKSHFNTKAGAER